MLLIVNWNAGSTTRITIPFENYHSLLDSLISKCTEDYLPQNMYHSLGQEWMAMHRATPCGTETEKDSNLGKNF